MKEHKRHKCSKCDRTATWFYLPGTKRRLYFCDECVPRGCYCNVMDIDMEEPNSKDSENAIWWSKEAYRKCIDEKLDPMQYCTHERQPDSYHYEILDEAGRREPCCEYEWSPDGFEFEAKCYVVTTSEVIRIFDKVKRKYLNCNPMMVQGIERIISEYIDNEYVVEYNKFMTKVAMLCRPYTLHMIIDSVKRNLKFYNSFRSQLYEKRIDIFAENTNIDF